MAGINADDAEFPREELQLLQREGQGLVFRMSFDIGVELRGEEIAVDHAADVAGSRNVIGIKNPAIDKLIERVIFTRDRADLVAATKALDRVLLWNHYVVPQWNYPKVRTARWDRFGRPAELPKYGQSGFPAIWWYDAGKAAKIGTRS